MRRAERKECVHADHVAGLPGVLRGREVGAIETTGFEEPWEQARFVRARAAAEGVPVTRAAAGERRRVGALDWQVLWPPAEQARPAEPIGPAAPAGSAPVPAQAQAPTTTPEGPNDASVTLLVRAGGLNLLLLGDLEPPSQRALLRSPAAATLGPVDVLKVAHHGSAHQDPELLRRVAPRLALISCGADNSYGHPSPRTVDALRGGGAEVLRTDKQGSIAVVEKGSRTTPRLEVATSEEAPPDVTAADAVTRPP